MVKERPSRLDEGEHRQAAPAPLSLEEALLSAGLVAAPIAWALHLVVSYGLIYPAERWQSKTPLHLTSLLSLLPALFSILVGLWGLRRARRAAQGDPAQRERMRFMAICSCLGGGFFVLAIIAQSVPVFMLALGSHE
jgi:hypothetical protein